MSSSYLPNLQTVVEARGKVQTEAAKLRDENTPPTPQAVYGKLDEPLGKIINALRTALAQSSRQHELQDDEAEQAPPAYREAVADYFERLSRDYETAPQEPAK